MDATIAVTLDLTDVNEPRVFREASVEVFEVSENTHNLTSPSGNYEGTGAIEPDAGAKLTYSLTPQPSKPAGDKASFTIDAATGWISLADEATIDYEPIIRTNSGPRSPTAWTPTATPTPARTTLSAS